MKLNINKDIAHDLRNIAQRLCMIKEDINELSKCMTKLFLDVENSYEERDNTERINRSIASGPISADTAEGKCEGKDC
jgi:hypothetical protein